MKKLITMAMALLISGALQAQEETVKKESKSYLVLHAGPSLPVGDFSSTNVANQQAGFAKTGYTINLNYGYQFQKNAGITVGAFYNSYNTHGFAMSFLEGTSGAQTISLGMDHWKMYGISAGPMLTFDVAKNIVADVKVMGGIANANSPKITYEGTVMAEGDWSFTPAIQGGVQLRINTGGNVFVMANADYMYLKPKFTYTYTNEASQVVNEDIRQKLSVVNLSAGIGFKF